LIDEQSTEEKETLLQLITPRSSREAKKNEEIINREKARILIERSQPDFDALVALFARQILVIITPKMTEVDTSSGSTFSTTSEVYFAGQKLIDVKIEASSPVCEIKQTLPLLNFVPKLKFISRW
jgi:hypothetical protein